MTQSTLADRYPEDGAFIDGFYLEGARWLLDTDADTQKVSGVEVQGELVESKLKELLSLMPVVYLKAVQVPKPPKNEDEKPKRKLWTADSVGYIRNDPNIYECPIYQVRSLFLSVCCSCLGSWLDGVLTLCFPFPFMFVCTCRQRSVGTRTYAWRR